MNQLSGKDDTWMGSVCETSRNSTRSDSPHSSVIPTSTSRIVSFSTAEDASESESLESIVYTVFPVLM